MNFLKQHWLALSLLAFGLYALYCISQFATNAALGFEAGLTQLGKQAIQTGGQTVQNISNAWSPSTFLSNLFTLMFGSGNTSDTNVPVGAGGTGTSGYTMPDGSTGSVSDPGGPFTQQP